MTCSVRLVETEASPKVTPIATRSPIRASRLVSVLTAMLGCGPGWSKSARHWAFRASLRLFIQPAPAYMAESRPAIPIAVKLLRVLTMNPST